MKASKAEIAVFVSGGGTNLQALIDAQKSGIIEHGEIKLVVSSNPNAYALERAAKAGIKSVTVSKKEFGSQAAVEEKIIEILEENNIDLIVLAGYMSILSADFTRRYERRITVQDLLQAALHSYQLTYVHSLLPDSPLPLLLRSFSIIWRNPEHLPYLQM